MWLNVMADLWLIVGSVPIVANPHLYIFNYALGFRIELFFAIFDFLALCFLFSVGWPIILLVLNYKIKIFVLSLEKIIVSTNKNYLL